MRGEPETPRGTRAMTPEARRAPKVLMSTTTSDSRTQYMQLPAGLFG